MEEFFSILYPKKMEEEDTSSKESSDVFVDLHLDQVIQQITEGKEDYHLKPFFHTPLHKEEDILYRQQVMQDIETPDLISLLKTLAAGIHEMQHLLEKREKYFYEYQKERAFLDASAVYCRAVAHLDNGLQTCDLGSKGMQAFHNYLSAYLSSPEFLSFSQATNSLLADLTNIRYNVLIDGLTVHVQPHHDEPDYSREIADIFERFPFDNRHNHTEETDASPEMNQVEALILKGVATLYPQIFRRLKDFPGQNNGFRNETVMRFAREIQFYISYADYISGIRVNGLQFCFPEIAGQKNDLFADNTYDLALAKKLSMQNKPVVTNDFHLKGNERILIITGPNQGGKTTFSRCFGQMHYFASLGLPVQGSAAKLLLYDHIYTHFERSEEVQSHRSKFEDDLIRVHSILKNITGSSIVVLNEIFSSTSLEDAIFLCRKIMEKISSVDALCVWVTFIDELVSFSDKTVSMVSLVDNTAAAERTFKIVRKKSNGIAYALSIAGKYKVTYQQLKERLTP